MVNAVLILKRRESLLAYRFVSNWNSHLRLIDWLRDKDIPLNVLVIDVIAPFFRDNLLFLNGCFGLFIFLSRPERLGIELLKCFGEFIEAAPFSHQIVSSRLQNRVLKSIAFSKTSPGHDTEQLVLDIARSFYFESPKVVRNKVWLNGISEFRNKDIHDIFFAVLGCLQVLAQNLPEIVLIDIVVCKLSFPRNASPACFLIIQRI